MKYSLGVSFASLEAGKMQRKWSRRAQSPTVSEQFNILHDNELHDLYRFPSIVRIFKFLGAVIGWAYT
jgi:hypothetical protein